MPKTKITPVKRPRAGLKEIAALAGVSVGSVSSVLNNRHLERRIPLDTAEAIRKAAAQLGYLPNISARRLRSGTGPKNSVLLALITSFEAPIPLIHQFLLALRQEAEAGNLPPEDYACSLMIEMFSAGRLCDMPGLLTGDHFNAAIVLNTVATDDQFLQRSHVTYPIVLVNRNIPSYSSVTEEESCGTRPAEVFAGIKRTRLAVLRGSPLTQSTERRVNSFIRRSAELIGKPAQEIVAGKLSETAAYEAMTDYLASGQRCDGLFCVSDALAVGAYRAIKEAGFNIPADIAIIGVGDYQTASFMDPPLSCIGVSHTAMAELASRQLIRLLMGDTAARENIHAPTIENLRASTGH
ncbi:MAG: LacI family DNA-binding transcriptional regulator [Opitutaceae bacterium]|jgi:LacI family transcriptional regulator